MTQEQMRDVLDLSVEAADYLVAAAERGAGDPMVAEVLGNLREIAVLIERGFINTQGGRRQIYLYAKNVQASVDDLLAHPALCRRIVSSEIRPFVMEMQRLWMLDTEVLATPEGRRSYRQDVMERTRALHQAAPKEYKYDVSIQLLAYNKLDYTKRAAESILQYTDFSKGNIELILINNGSEDGTREYFESLPYTKIINLRHNILGTFSYIHLLEGKYYVGFSNDVVATPHWLDHLLACMESDDRIAIAVPTCNEGSISNCQGIPVPYPNTFAGLERMQAFAAAHNHLDPALWAEWPVLMPFLFIMRTDVYRMGLIDPIYTRGEFVDDDLSTTLRRSGWRQVLLKDTFMHHFGGVTLGEGRKNEAGNALVEMRRVYYEKWGVDAWDSRGGFFGAEILERWHTVSANERVLVLEPRFGDLACCLFNTYRRSGHTPHMTAAVFDERYLMDTDYLFDETVAVRHIGDIPAQGRYDVISAGCYLDELPLGNVVADLERLYELLAPNGVLLLPVRNPSCAYEMDAVMRTGMRDVYSGAGEVKPCVSISDLQLLQAIHEHPRMNRYKMHTISFREDVALAERMKPLLRGDEKAVSDQLARLSVRMFFLGIFCSEQGDGNLQQSGK